MFFWNSSFSDDPTDVDNLISGSCIIRVKNTSVTFSAASCLRGNCPYPGEGALGAGSTDSALVLLEKSVASGRGCVARRLPLYPPISVVAGVQAPPPTGAPPPSAGSALFGLGPELTPGLPGSRVGQIPVHGDPGARTPAWRQVSRAAGEEGRALGRLTRGCLGKRYSHFPTA